MKILVQGRVAAILALAFCAECLAQSPAKDHSGRTGKSIFKYSHVPAWFDGPDDYKHYDVDVIVQDMDLVDERDVGRWKAFIDEIHKQGKILCAEMRPLTHLGRQQEYLMSDPGMQEAVCVDFNLNPIPTSWMIGRAYKSRPVYLYCSNNPRYRAYLRHQVYMYAEAGADGVMVDDGGGAMLAFSYGGCFCQYCTAGFREYLRNKYTPAELLSRGIDNLAIFDYRKVVLRHADDIKSFSSARSRGEIPLSTDYDEFLKRSDASLFRSLQEMASKLSGKHIPMGWDNFDFAGSRSLYYDFLDVFYSEITYQHFAVHGKGPDEEFPPAIIFLNKLSDALGKWYMPAPAPWSWTAIKTKNLTGLLKQWIAFTYANGGAFRFPRKGWCFGETSRWYYPSKDEFAPLYDFVKSHRELLDGYEALEQVGVLFTQSPGGAADPYYTPLKHVCASLVNLNIPFGMAVAGDEWLTNRLNDDQVKRFELMLVPDPVRLADGQERVVQRWRDQNRALSIRTTDDVAARLRGRINPLVSLNSGSSVWLFPRRSAGNKSAPVVCHVINSSYDAWSNRIILQTGVEVDLKNGLFGGAPVKSITYYTIGSGPQTLPHKADKDGVRVTIPSVDLWGILQLSTK